MYIVYWLFPFSCPTPTAAAVEQVQWAVVRCCKCLFWMISLGACIRFFMVPVIFCAYFILTYFDLRCEHLLVCHPNSSQNESCGWLQIPDSVQFAQNPFKLDFNPKPSVCKYPKPYFRVIPLFSWIMEVYTHTLILYMMLTHIYVYTYVYTYVYKYICICMFEYTYKYIYI